VDKSGKIWLSCWVAPFFAIQQKEKELYFTFQLKENLVKMNDKIYAPDLSTPIEQSNFGFVNQAYTLRKS
jgi:hypothetical protein